MAKTQYRFLDGTLVPESEIPFKIGAKNYIKDSHKQCEVLSEAVWQCRRLKFASGKFVPSELLDKIITEEGNNKFLLINRNKIPVYTARELRDNVLKFEDGRYVPASTITYMKKAKTFYRDDYGNEIRIFKSKEMDASRYFFANQTLVLYSQTYKKTAFERYALNSDGIEEIVYCKMKFKELFGFIPGSNRKRKAEQNSHSVKRQTIEFFDERSESSAESTGIQDVEDSLDPIVRKKIEGTESLNPHSFFSCSTVAEKYDPADNGLILEPLYPELAEYGLNIN